MQSQTRSPVDSEWWRLPRVIAETGLSRPTIYRLMGDGKFPSNHAPRSARAKVWFEDEVRAWKRGEFGLPAPAPAVAGGGLGDLL